ncbi:AraC family transcriptional regulator [Kribbella sp. NBC_00662]|uniref:AraC family transcriptional regulator n=1 Tax=Kribbella sp. NBC_00662 TaxID=2975969 RepID=UPI003245ABD8
MTIVVPVELLPHLRRARDVADRNYAEPLDLAALATAARVSKYHFLRCFAAEYGETPMQYVTRRRTSGRRPGRGSRGASCSCSG